MKDKIRIQIDIPIEQNKELLMMMDQANISTKKDLFNNALAMLRWALKEKALGKEIASVDASKDSYKELHMPIFDNVQTTK